MEYTKHSKFFVCMIKHSGKYNGISTFDSLIIEDNDNGAKIPLICYDFNEIKQYRQNK